MIDQTASANANANANAAREKAPWRDAQEMLRSLRVEGLHAIDPVGFHYLETLASRAQNQQGSVQRILQDKLMSATLAFMEHDRAAQSKAVQTDKTSPTQGRESLRGLVESLGQHCFPQESTATEVRISPQPELKSIQYFRSTWSKLSMDRQVAHAFAHAPKNAGPLNSHVMALRSLALMRDISPDYLNRFLGYVDTLVRLDQSGTVTGLNRKLSTGTDADRKKRGRR
jgi:hypothetical protein